MAEAGPYGSARVARTRMGTVEAGPGTVAMRDECDDQALFLFDIDSTLLKGGTAVHRESFAHAFREVYGLPLSLDGIPAAGRTDSWLLAEPLRLAGVSDVEIRRRMPDAFREMETYVDKYLGDLRDRVLPGVPDVLTQLGRYGHILGLLTGNLSAIALAKLEKAGIGQYFNTGGFGEESEIRSDLVPIALRHAGEVTGRTTPPGRTVVVGDTPLDIEAGRAHGTRTAGVATGPFSIADLQAAGADLVLESLEDSTSAVAALVALSREP